MGFVLIQALFDSFSVLFDPLCCAFREKGIRRVFVEFHLWLPSKVLELVKLTGEFSL